MIKKESISPLKEQIDIVEVISSYIDLRKSGSSFKARCPFHEEKTPSFIVSPHRQSFHCFGCGVHGEYGIELQYENREIEDDEVKDKIAILEIVNRWFISNLHKRGEALQYLKNRGLNDETIKKFQLGYAPSSQDFFSFLELKNISFNKCVDVGLLAFDENSKNYYSRFHQRIIFPIFNPSGKVIAFGGRTLSNHPAKYINSPSTNLFNKSKILYGYNFAKKSIFQHNKINVVEGYLDVIMLHQIGIENSVAPLGTALTKEHSYILKKSGKINLAFDGDRAGVEAIKKALDILLPLKVESSVTIFQNGYDPAQLIQDGKVEELKKILNSPKDGVKFYIQESLSSFNLKNPYEKAQAVSLAKKIISKLPSLLLQREYVKYLDRVLSVGATEISFNRKIDNRERIDKKEFFGHFELAILRSILLNRENINLIKNELSINDFEYYRDYYQDILNENWASVKLHQLELMESEIFNTKELEIEVINFKIKKLNQANELLLKNQNIDLKTKFVKSRELRYSLIALKKRKMKLISSL